jgi:hypothetical protein
MGDVYYDELTSPPHLLCFAADSNESLRKNRKEKLNYENYDNAEQGRDS